MINKLNALKGSTWPLLNRSGLTLKPFLGSLKTPEEKSPSYFSNVCNMHSNKILSIQQGKLIHGLKLVRSLGSL